MRFSSHQNNVLVTEMNLIFKACPSDSETALTTGLVSHELPHRQKNVQHTHSVSRSYTVLLPPSSHISMFAECTQTVRVHVCAVLPHYRMPGQCADSRLLLHTSLVILLLLTASPSIQFSSLILIVVALSLSHTRKSSHSTICGG